MSVNGETSKHLVFANTRGWSNFWTTSVRVNLKKGENTIRFGNANTGTASESGKASGWAPNFDYIQVAPTTDGVEYADDSTESYLYYVDAGARGTNPTTSAAYDAAVRAAQQAKSALLNTKPDQQTNGKWGASTAVKVGTLTGKADNTVLNATGKSMGYRFTLPAGTYKLTAGLGGIGKAGVYSQKVSWTGGSQSGNPVTVSATDADPVTGDAAVIDPVLDFDLASGEVDTRSAAAILAAPSPSSS